VARATRPFLVAVAALVAAAAGPSGQSSDQVARPRFGTSTAAVSVDVIVHDRKGRPVTDLTRADFDVYEDGVQQTIISFDAIEPLAPAPAGPAVAAATPGPGTPAPPAAPPPSADPVKGQSAVALVFDWLSDQSRRDAWKAARTMLQDMQPGDYAAVFAIDHSLKRLVPFTNDIAALDRAFALALERPRPGSSRQGGALANAMVARPENSPTAGAADGGVPASTVAGPDPNAHNGDAQLAALLQSIDDFDRYADKEIQSQAGSDSLRSLVEQMGVLYGRKTVILFSEGLAITNHYVDSWRRLEDAANRLNVSFYTFDAQGLRVQSQQAAMGRMLPAASGSGVPGAMGFSRGQYGDRYESALEALLNGPTAGLAELASATGGRYISNTNDLATPFHEVNQDRRYYYLLGYSSTNPSLDGSFRKITVKVHRSGVTVRSRSGYRAVPTVERTDRRDFEAPALAALQVSPPPSAFPLRLRALSTPMPDRPGTLALVAALDSGALTFKTDAAAARYQGQATIVARVVSPAGDTETTRSEHYNLTGDLPHLAKAKGGEVLFFAAPSVPGGSHTVEWAVRDDEGERTSVARQQVTVPAASGLTVGDLFLVAHTERAPKGKAMADNPLAWDGVLLYPDFGSPISKANAHEISFALPMVLADAAGPTASLELLNAGRTLATIPLDLAKPEKDGRLMALGRLPISALPPASYELRVTVAAGERREVRTAAFMLIP
jgi:VWFA-related protein